MAKYKNKYRIESARLQTWDYSWSASYFITICTKKRYHYFGKIENGTMELSTIGVIANVLWYEIKNHTRNVILNSFVVMPNHVHGILTLTELPTDNETNINDNDDDVVETRHALSLPSQPPPPLPQSQPPQNKQQTIGQKRFQNQGKNTVSSIIGSYKSAVTKHARRLGYEFAWQTRFHDHIIRNNQSFMQISEYIVNNPKKWKNDKFYDK